MTSLFDGALNHLEPSSLTAFAGNDLIRDSEHRDEETVAAALKTEGAHIFAFCEGNLILKHDGQIVDPLFSRYELVDLLPDWDETVLLGHRRNGEPRLAVPVKVPEESLATHFKVVDGRTLYRDELMDEALLGEFAQAASLIRWNRDNRFCGRCGGAMELRIGGYKRACVSCDHMIFPRTDPVVIMLVIDEERDLCLLGRGPHFAPGMYSCLAGFLEPGETMENAVRRETLEEAGIKVGRVRYHASQPWPMPHSLMIGCYGQALNAEIHRDEKELEDCRWFTREETLEMLEMPGTNGKASPPKGAIAHRLMRDWVERKL